jgi:hypothetical protein
MIGLARFEQEAVADLEQTGTEVNFEPHRHLLSNRTAGLNAVDRRVADNALCLRISDRVSDR